MMVQLPFLPQRIPWGNTLLIYQKEYGESQSMDDFRDLYLGIQLKYFASDLLREGFTPQDIREAVQKAMTACKTASLEVRKHFSLVYTQVSGGSIYDCKLSKFGYALVLLNARPDIPIVARWQAKMAAQVLD